MKSKSNISYAFLMFVHHVVGQDSVTTTRSQWVRLYYVYAYAYVLFGWVGMVYLRRNRRVFDRPQSTSPLAEKP